MNYKWFIVLLIVYIFFGCESNNAQEKNSATNQISIKEVDNLPKPEGFRDGYSYTLGYDLGTRMRFDSLDPNIEYFIQGVRQALMGDSAFYSKMERDSIMRVFNDSIMKVQEKIRILEDEKMRKIGEDNAKKNPEFLAENLKQPGWKKTHTGLQYKVVKEGQGKSPDINDVVEIHLKGTLIDGTEFDNSYKRGQSVTFSPQGVIPGWREALLMMKPGAKYKVVIPPELGYKDQPAGKIPPNSVLIFDIEMLNNFGPVEQGGMPMIQDAQRVPKN